MPDAAPSFAFENTYARDLPGLYQPWKGAAASAPRLLVLNAELAAELGLDAEALRRPEGVAILAGSAVPEGATPIAQAYSGHQFGGFSPRLGDGRALLLGELIDVHGRRRDIHLKGSGRTPFARGGDGRAAVGPMLREHVIGETMHALGIPTTRALAVVATGDIVVRETHLPGAVLARVAASHLRVGTFEYASALGNPDTLRRLADYAIARHHPAAADAPNPYLALFAAVAEAQASLIARWMQVGFIHGVMNTDNMTISGETIDYGPCAFMEAFDPRTVFSSIDHGGRYAYGNQPSIAQWNLARLAEALLSLIDEDSDVAVAAATEVLESFPERYLSHLLAGMRTKLGLSGAEPADDQLVDDLLGLMREQRVDFTTCFRQLAQLLRGEAFGARLHFDGNPEFDAFCERWRERLASQSSGEDAVADAMDRVNPLYIPRNHKVEEALAAATDGDLEPFERLVEALRDPFTECPGLESFAQPAPETFGPYRTFCGT